MTSPPASLLRRRWATWLGLLLAQALAVGLYLWVEARRGEAGRAQRFSIEEVRGVPVLPDAALQRFDGGVMPARQLLGRPLLLHFWAAWCGPCREELPELLAWGREGGGAEVVAVALEEDWGSVAAFFDGGIPPEVLRDPGGALARTYGVGPLPESWLLDPGGRALLRMAGARRWQSDAAREALGPFLERARAGEPQK